MNASFTYSQAFEADEYESVIYIHASSRGISNMNASFTCVYVKNSRDISNMTYHVIFDMSRLYVIFDMSRLIFDICHI